MAGKHPEQTFCSWKFAAVLLLIVSAALLITLIVVATKKSDTADGKASLGSMKAEFCAAGMSWDDVSEQNSGVFDDLNVKEITAVRDYMLGQPTLNLAPYDKATVSSNYIYLIQLLPPPKDRVLEFLDSNGSKPSREAIVVVFQGGGDPPMVEEYIVSPVDEPSQYVPRRVSGQRYPIPFNARPFDGGIEFPAIDQFLLTPASKKVQRLLSESYDGFTYSPNCDDRCLQVLYTTPMGFSSYDRSTWLFFVRDLPGHYIHPLDMAFYVDHSGANPSKWRLLQVLYNNQTFNSVDELMEKYDTTEVRKIVLPLPVGDDALFSTYQRRGAPQPSKPMRGPEIYEPDGKRYVVNKHHVKYMSWSFEFRVDSNRGLQIYDIRFNKGRIVYELSLQEVVGTYSGYFPYQSRNNFLDGNWRLGMSSYEMVQGIDCPNTATFFDLVHMIGSGKPLTFRNAVCVFELNTGIPLRRHYDNNFMGGYKFYGGMVNNVLVLRTTSTVYNYDFVYDYIFYQNGVIEVRLSTTGYLVGTFFSEDDIPYAYPIHDSLTSTVHDHLMNYKVDLDVGGRKNSYETIEIGIENITDRWIPNQRRVQKILKRSVKKTEQEAAYKFDFDHPKYLNFFNEGKKNRMGVNKGYRIQLGAVIKQLYPEDWMMTPMLSWSLYQMAVTKYKENETQSSSIYNQNAPSDPQIDFRKYLQDNDSIINEDLVVWVTIGVMHVPHSEDLPNTPTAANSANFFIRPFNHFDEDPSMSSTNAILITPTDTQFSGQKVERYGTPDGPQCVPKKHKFEFKGTYG